MRNKQLTKKIAKTGATGVTGVLLLILKVFATILLICLTTGVIFACIFTVYIKTNLLSQDLDIDLESYKMNLTSSIYCTDPDTGETQLLVELQGSEFRTWIDYEDIPITVEHAVVSIEDQRFYKHHGVDWYRTAGAFVNMFVGMKNTFGGSTITQQLIKNVTEQDDVTVQRKLLEIFRALELEKAYDKEEIIELYLNLVYFGHSRYGIAAAAEYYFDKEVSGLTLAEIASIVGITNNPSMYSPYLNKEKNKERQETILFKMKEQGYISQAEYDTAVAQELVFKRGENETDETVIYTWFEEAVISDAMDQIAEEKGCSRRIANSLLLSGGYQIYTTMNPKIQSIVDEYYENPENFATSNSKQLQSGIVITNPYTGDILAMSGGVGEKTINRGLNRATDAKRPPGSSIKPLSAYSLAMDLGLITPNTLIEDSADVTLEGTTWMPKNDSRTYTEGGIVTIREGLRRSLNTVAAQLLDKITPQVSYDFLTQKLGFTSLVPEDNAYAPLSMGQLTNGATVREMAQAYSIFPNSGVYTESRTYTHICDSEGNVVYENIPETHAAISDVTAYWMTSMLQDVVSAGTGTAAKISGMPTAGKTGTSGSSKDRWFVGFTPYYVAAVWVGYDTPAKISWSGNPAAQIFKKIMTVAHEGLEAKKFSVPSNTYQAPVPGVEPVEYRVRGLDELGNVLYDNVLQGIVERELTITAEPLEGYTLISPAEVKLTISEVPAENIVEFQYQSTALDPSDDPNVTDDPDITDDPSPSPSQNPTPSPEPSLSPSQSPTPSPEPSPSPSQDPVVPSATPSDGPTP